MSGAEGGSDDSWFGRPITEISDGGGLFADVQRAETFPQTMQRETVVKGGLLFVASIFYLPAPLLIGYVLAVAEAIGDDEPAPTFENWQRYYMRGLGASAIVIAVVFFSALIAVLASGGGELSDTGSGLLVLAWFYATPWALAVYGSRTWRAFGESVAWRWLVSPHYLLTGIATGIVLSIGYILFALSVITIIGWVFVGFLVLSVVGALLGQRYRSYRDTHETVDATVTSDLGVGATVSSLQSAVSASASAVGATASTDSPSTGGASPAVETETTGEETDYTRYRERARHASTDGPLDLLEAGDGGRVQFVSLDDNDETATEAFERAVDRWDSIEHNEAVTTVHDTGSEPTPWAAFEPLDGSLDALGGTLSSGGVVAVTAAVEDALTIGRRYNIAHGSVRPACIAVERAGGTGSAASRVDATLGGWGLRRELAAATEDAALPARYAAPEQFAGGAADDAVDVYQLGAVAHYALFGEPPFADVEPAELRAADRSVEWSVPSGHHVTDETVTVFERALATDPDDRYDSTGDVVVAFRNALDAEL